VHILVVEDEAKTSAFLRKGLSEAGFVADVATNGEDGLHLALNVDYDLVVLDIMLPDRDGWSVLAELRRAGRECAVICLTARDSVHDRVHGLELGADDYLVKPFAFSELLARIRSVLRRGPGKRPEMVRIADLEIDLVRRRACRGGVKLDLGAREFALLSLLARSSGDVLSRTLIAEQVWDANFDTDSNVVDVAIRRLRQKIDEPFEKKLIRTVRGVGYVLDEH
jgi:two-component system, OmpR family, copper resistance phosphate regulon response regulator CusR